MLGDMKVLLGLEHLGRSGSATASARSAPEQHAEPGRDPQVALRASLPSSTAGRSPGQRLLQVAPARLEELRFVQGQRQQYLLEECPTPDASRQLLSASRARPRSEHASRRRPGWPAPARRRPPERRESHHQQSRPTSSQHAGPPPRLRGLSHQLLDHKVAQAGQFQEQAPPVRSQRGVEADRMSSVQAAASACTRYRSMLTWLSSRRRSARPGFGAPCAGSSNST